MLRLVAWDLLFASGAALAVYLGQKALPVSWREGLFGSESTTGKIALHVAVAIAAATAGGAGVRIAKYMPANKLHAAFEVERHRIRVSRPEHPRFQALEAIGDARDDWMTQFVLTESERVAGHGIHRVAAVVRTHLKARSLSRPVLTRSMGKTSETLSLALRDLEAIEHDDGNG